MLEIRNPISEIPTASHKPPLSRRFLKIIAALASFEVVFLLFMWAGRYKTSPFLSPSPVDLTLLFFLLSIFAALVVFYKEVNIFQSLYDSGSVIFLLLIIWIPVTFLWSSQSGINLTKMIHTVFLLSWSFFAPYLLISTNKERIHRFIIAIMVFSLLMMFYWAHIRFVLGIRYIGADETSFYAPNYLGYGEHAMVLAFGFFGLALTKENGLVRVIYFILVILAIILLLFMGGKGPLGVTIIVLSIMSLIMMFTQNIDKSVIRYFQFFLVSIFALTLIIVGFSFADQDTIKKIELELATVERLFIMFRGQSGFDGSTNVRVQAQEVALNLWFGTPFIGRGIGEFCIVDPILCYPHNLVIEVLMELGLVGFWLLVGILVLGSIRMRQIWRPNCSDWAILMICMTFISAIISRTTYQGHLPDERLMFAMLGIILGLGRDQKNASSRRQAAAQVGFSSRV